jgi:hypothetical protein
MAATLAVGLRNDSRIKMKIQERSYSSEILLLASAIDRLSILIWQNTKDGQKGINKPEMLVEKLTKKDKPKEIISFKSGEDFLKEWERINGN